MNDRRKNLSPEEQPPALSIIIPTFNEAPVINQTLDAVMSIRGRVEVIVVDGGSFDGMVEIVRGRGVRVITSERGRGAQMHAGACAAHGAALWFLHADTHPSSESAERIIEALRDPQVVAGNFNVRFEGTRRAARFLTWLYPQLRKLGLAYGDSAIFVRRGAYEQVGGFQPFPIFEDLDLVRRLRRRGRIAHLPTFITTSSRRFEDRSFTLTFGRWALLQMLYWLGVHPRTLGRLYAPIRGAGRKSGKGDGSTGVCGEARSG
ncbi:MAG: TIGR04283 family arsenosugar biosynthesis glycosyltransferase [Acidobacteriota bacterium]|nr:TIGR04283 family arsenosugar biosynthesis glycosyltransferase [Acidobacteriota bacterium]